MDPMGIRKPIIRNRKSGMIRPSARSLRMRSARFNRSFSGRSAISAGWLVVAIAIGLLGVHAVISVLSCIEGSAILGLPGHRTGVAYLQDRCIVRPWHLDNEVIVLQHADPNPGMVTQINQFLDPGFKSFGIPGALGIDLDAFRAK